MPANVVIPVGDPSAVGEARRAAARLAEGAGLNETDRGRVSIVASELATNLARHAKHGQMLMTLDAGAVELTAADAGPGMDVARCLADGYSTGGTSGTGLGAARRMSDEMDVFSSPGGTVIWARVGVSARAVWKPAGLGRGVVSVAAPGEAVCGDGWRVARDADGRVAVVVADGLGHGPLAAEAAEGACAVFEADPFASPRAMVEAMHGAIGGTRGAAVAVARVDGAGGRLTFAGVGNVSGTLLDPAGRRGLMSHNGTVGHQVRKVQEIEYPWGPGAVLVLHSDGVQTRWAMDGYPGLARRHPAVVAGVLYRDFRRGRDDATVVVVGAFESRGCVP